MKNYSTRIVAESMQRFQLTLCVSVVNALVFHLILPPFTYSVFVGEYHYQDFVSFLTSDDSCGFIPLNISSHLKNDQSKSNDICMGFITTVENIYAKAQINNVEVKYFAYDVQYSYESKRALCQSDRNVQPVDMMLICRGETVVNGTRCDKDSTCERKGEVCKSHFDMDHQFCIPTRYLYQSCDNDSQCDRNSDCRLLGSIRTCLCLDGYIDINGRCVKAELFLGEECTYDVQCSVKNNASRCLYNETENSRVCSCVKGYIASGSICIADGLFLHQLCTENKQCTGTENANKCTSYGNESQSSCKCNDGHIEKNETCYKVNRRLHESCDWSEQCTGSFGANKCKSKYGVKICLCPEGRDNFKGSCLKVGVPLDEPCWVDGQCTGTPHSGVCMADLGKHGTLLCQCSTGFIKHNASCLQVGKRLFETCSHHQQCNGTYNTMNCTDLNADKNKVCFCQRGYLDFKGRCIKASRKFHDKCETQQQCTGTENANTCRLIGDSSKCSCNDKFDLINGTCLKIGRKLFEPCVNNIQCNGTRNARNCTDIYVDNNKVCFCQDGYLEYKGRCVQAKRRFHETCITHQQCTGTDNANTCHFEDGVCICSNRYKVIDGKCLEAALKLYESCISHEQCYGTEFAGNCTEIENKRVCLCQDGYLDFKGKCIKANRKFNESCKVNEECKGTENANICQYMEGKGSCRCDKEYALIGGKCLKLGLNLLESCFYNEQCSGTDIATNCTDIGNNTVCFCQDSYFNFKGRCIKDKRNLDDMCEINLQCSGTENAGVCGKTQTCTCDEGFIRSKEGCLPEKDMLLLLIAVGGFFGIITCLLTILFALKRRNTNTKRLECRSSPFIPVRNIRYSIVDNSACGSSAETTAENRQSFSNALAENIYDEAYQREEQGTENFYSRSEPQFRRKQESDNDIYNHPHQKPIQMSEAIYGVPKSMSESMCSKIQEHKL